MITEAVVAKLARRLPSGTLDDLVEAPAVPLVSGATPNDMLPPPIPIVDAHDLPINVFPPSSLQRRVPRPVPPILGTVSSSADEVVLVQATPSDNAARTAGHGNAPQHTMGTAMKDAAMSNGSSPTKATNRKTHSNGDSVLPLLPPSPPHRSTKEILPCASRVRPGRREVRDASKAFSEG
ncbi:hypothetical protein JVT61DRAFT_9013 [Boletus reticuloceps]|uniref:Uncharacterized protein n=1 Tax=Boletus reticuloceps TaxID=495285 RepID=A0A8I2YGV5_9AGAM|nr:hypothetical protein JVT61DRAFT_9013 [Boletus reticuloceps]